jgi:hypothetical protein
MSLINNILTVIPIKFGVVKSFIVKGEKSCDTHIDHYGSAEELKTKTGAPLTSHKTDAEYLKNYIGIPTEIVITTFVFNLLRRTFN